MPPLMRSGVGSCAEHANSPAVIEEQQEQGNSEWQCRSPETSSMRKLVSLNAYADAGSSLILALRSNGLPLPNLKVGLVHLRDAV